MQKPETAPLILTLRLCASDAGFFNTQRKLYFPAERNHLEAHLMLFHQLPAEPATYHYLSDLRHPGFFLEVVGLMNLGAGVAYRMDSPELLALHRSIKAHFDPSLIPQDRQGFRPHVTIMNKSTPAKARELLAKLTPGFRPFAVEVTGLDLWTYLGGPWQHATYFSFTE
ncbi:2'-5' RNA ligase family protein [Mucilaginibacter gynuensis]|uniref:2'-5' RNA ligase family protein n=1 Tax=Mucilaginibacter gynuensis TaxID=1302236 RepID=UPI0031ED27FF